MVLELSWHVPVGPDCGRRPELLDTLGIEPRAFRMRSGCDTITPCARCIT